MTISKTSWWKHLWDRWIQFGHWMGNILSWVWMPLFYFLFAMPVALAIKIFSDPLRLRVGKQKSYWTPKQMPELDLAWAKSQGGHLIKGTEPKS